jgi:hypothetical protein
MIKRMKKSVRCICECMYASKSSDTGSSLQLAFGCPRCSAHPLPLELATMSTGLGEPSHTPRITQSSSSKYQIPFIHHEGECWRCTDDVRCQSSRMETLSVETCALNRLRPCSGEGLAVQAPDPRGNILDTNEHTVERQLERLGDRLGQPRHGLGVPLSVDAANAADMDESARLSREEDTQRH